MHRLALAALLCACGTEGVPASDASPVPDSNEVGVDEPHDAAVDNTNPVAPQPDDLYGVVFLIAGSLIVAEIDTTSEMVAAPDVGFSLRHLDEDPSTATSLNGRVRLDYTPGTLLQSAVESLQRPRTECTFFPILDAEVVGPADSAVFVRRGSLVSANAAILSQTHPDYETLTDLAREHERTRDVFSNKALARTTAAVERVVAFQSSGDQYAVVVLERRDDNPDTGGRQQFAVVLRRDATGRFVPDGQVYSESDFEGKGLERLRVLFAATTPENRPVLVTALEYWGGNGGVFYVRIAEGDWRPFARWGSGC